MLEFTDSGCEQHPPQRLRLTGPAAVLMGRLILNLSPTDTGHTYICEHGHTHCLTLQPRQGKATSSPPRFGVTGNTPLTFSPGSGEEKFRSVSQVWAEASCAPALGVQTFWRRA